jgi:glycosyltransferase involved in cell wall biosynthesis
MKFSIITPTYKQTRFLRQTIDSVINQEGMFEIEYIICDGAANPEIITLIEQYSRDISSSSRYQHIDLKWFSERDSGQSEAINKGLMRATGDIIAYINDDDYYEPGAFNAVALALARPNAVWAYGQCRIVDEKNQEIRRFITLYKTMLLRLNRPSLLFSENYVPQPATFWKMEVMDEIGYLNENEYYSMDYDYWLRICNRFGMGHYIAAYLANFRFHFTSKTGAVNPKEYHDAFRVARNHGPNYKISLALHRFNTYRTILAYKMLQILKSSLLQ